MVGHCVVHRKIRSKRHLYGCWHGCCHRVHGGATTEANLVCTCIVVSSSLLSSSSTSMAGCTMYIECCGKDFNQQSFLHDDNNHSDISIVDSASSEWLAIPCLASFAANKQIIMPMACDSMARVLDNIFLVNMLMKQSWWNHHEICPVSFAKHQQKLWQ